MADPAEEIGNWNENYWVLRVEPVPKDEETLSEDDTIIRVAHIPAPKQQPAPSTLSTAGNEPAGADAANNASNNGSGGGAAAAGGGLISTGPAVNAPTGAVPFGDPFLLRVGPGETLGEVKGRIQEKLGVAAAEFDSWKFALVSTRAAPHYLAGEQGQALFGVFTAFRYVETRACDFHLLPVWARERFPGSLRWVSTRAAPHDLASES